jgi:hypothetical protein
LQVKKSSIPNANLGVFVTATPLSVVAEKSHFSLPVGHIIDMGVYAPMSSRDRISDDFSWFKDFIHGPSDYNFETIFHGREHDQPVVFDLTDHVSGELNEHAKRSVMPYFNETNGTTEDPIVTTIHDPTGAVHYGLGSKFNSLQLQAGIEYEAKVDYGDKYEDVRIQKNYSSLEPDDPIRVELEEKLATYDSDFVHDCAEMSPRKLMEGFSLVALFANADVTLLRPQKLARALFVAVLLGIVV